MKLFKPLFTLLYILTYISTLGQGCSDAGFCTMGAMKPDQLYSPDRAVKLRTLEVNFYRGKSTLSPVIYVATIDASFSLGSKSSIQIKLPIQAVQGRLDTTQGWGDLSLSATTSLYQGARSSFNGTMGFKIPTGQGNIEDKTDQDLPMYYQTSLGTFDLVAGASFINKNWIVATGIQVPLIHNNDNTFLWGEWPSFDDQEYLEKYVVGYQLKRGSDAMLRIEKDWRYSNFNFNLGLLNIYRFTKDQRLNRSTGEYEKMDGTTGFAISALAGFGYDFNVSSGIKIIYGYKLMDRDVNPDGLTRHAVLSVSYLFRF